MLIDQKINDFVCHFFYPAACSRGFLQFLVEVKLNSYFKQILVWYSHIDQQYFLVRKNFTQLLSYKILFYNRMNKLHLFFLITLAVHLTAIEVTNSLRIEDISAIKVPVNPPKTVPYVNLTRYLGLWYQQASIPAPFQNDCTNTFANYTLYQDESIRVINTCFVKGAEKFQMVGRAVPDPADTEHTNSKLKVRFPVSPVDGDYWIVRLDQSYSYVVVGSPSYNFMWIMYRSPRMPSQLYNSIIQDLKKDDFPVQRLKKTIIN